MKASFELCQARLYPRILGILASLGTHRVIKVSSDEHVVRLSFGPRAEAQMPPIMMILPSKPFPR